MKKFARKLLQFKRSLPPYLHWTRKLRDDPLFELAAVDRGLLPRPPSPTRTPAQRTETAERIIKAYRLASADQAGQPAVYKVSNEWIPLFHKPLRPLLAALDKGDPVALRDLLDNFFRNSISEGLIGLATDMEGAFFKRKPSRYLRTQLLIDSIYRYRLLEKLVPGVTAAKLHVEDFGNPYGVYVGEQFMRAGVDYQYFYAHKVSQMLAPKKGRAIVAELGGGIGGFAHFLCKERPSDLTYINLDLPEILCISSYQLLNLFPQKRVLLYGESERIDQETVSGYDLALLPSFAVESLEDDSVDISFNSYSLAEMDLDTIRNYAAHLSRISRQAILHVNHVSDSLVSADNFPFDAQKFELRSRNRALWNLGRNLTCDEYEFLLARRSA
ncbi:MAG: putative sugar O-methyltransferase [Burkholderiales bacterium]